MAYSHTNSKGTNYFLHSTLVKLRGGNFEQRIFYFAKKTHAGKALNEIPDGYKVIESKRTGLPVLKKK